MSDKLKVHQEQTMKHITGVIEINAWLAALVKARDEGVITDKAAAYLADTSGDFAREFVNGGKINGLTVDEVYPEDAPFFDTMVDNYNAFKQGYPDGR